jgi:type II pantothenate kinase
MPETVTSHDAAKSVAFPLLADPQGYVASSLNLCESAEGRGYWLGLFRNHFKDLLERAVADALDRGLTREEADTQAAQANASFGAYLKHVEAEPDVFGRLTVLALCHARERGLRQAGVPDPYRLAKRHENEVAMGLLPRVLGEVDALEGAERVERIMRGIFAGNLFDLGAIKTNEMFKNDHVDFHETLAKLKDRPGFYDDLDAWRDRWLDGPTYKCAVVFVDNAGPDVLLGMTPFYRELLRRGTAVILTANASPTLNDVTHDELTGLTEKIARFDTVIAEALKSGQLELITSGNGAPLIDLMSVNPELADAVTRRGADLCVLEGMGRAIETNYHARFACDTLKLAMIKDQGVGHELDAELYDLVLRFDRPA